MRFVHTHPDIPLPELPPPASEAPSVLAMSLAKAGSTLLYGMLQSLAPHAGLAYFSLEDQLFALGVPPNDRPPAASRLFRDRGYLYGGFRSFPHYDIPILGRARGVFLMRDPRDMIVSLYYSIAQSHRVPEREGAASSGGGGANYMRQGRSEAARLTLDQYCASAVIQYAKLLEGYLAAGILRRPNIAIYRYEDVIFEKRAWLGDICRWYDWPITPGVRNAVADRFDIVPEATDPAAHIRQVKPGNYRAELSPAGIELVERSLRPFMRIFGYL